MTNNNSIQVDYLEGPQQERETQHFSNIDAVKDWFVPILQRNAQLCLERKDEVLNLIEKDWVAAIDLYNETNAFKETIYIKNITKFQY